MGDSGEANSLFKPPAEKKRRQDGGRRTGRRSHYRCEARTRRPREEKDNGFRQQHNSFIRGLTLSGHGEISEGTHWKRGGRQRPGGCGCGGVRGLGEGGSGGGGWLPTWRVVRLRCGRGLFVCLQSDTRRVCADGKRSCRLAL